MIATFLITTLVLTPGGDHAAFHPKDTNLYFEVPDVAGSLEAYQEAPLVRLFEDPELQGFLGMVTGTDPEEISLPFLTGLLVDEVRSELPVAGIGFLDLIPEVNHASFSFAGIDLNGLMPLIQEVDRGELAGLHERLSELGVTLVVDFTTAETAEDAEHLIRSQLLELAINSAPQAPALIDASRAPGTKLDLSDYELTDQDHPLFVNVLRSAERLTVTLRTLPNIPATPKFEDSLAANERFKSTGAHWMESDGTTILNTYFSIEGVGELIELLELIPDCPPQVVDGANFFLETTMPGGQLHARMRTRLEGSQFHSESFTAQPGLNPNNQLISTEPITRESFRMAPANSAGVSAFNLNKEFLANSLMRGLVTMTGEEEQQLLATLKEDYGFHPVHDLIGSLGGSAVTYTLPYTSIGQPQVFLALDLENEEVFGNALEAFAKFVEEAGEGRIGVHARPYRKQPLVVFSPGKVLLEELFKSMGEAAPAFIQMQLVIGVTKDRAIISSSSPYTKREMKRLMKADLTERHPLMDEATDFPSGIQSYGTTDWGSMIAGGYDSLRGFLPLIASGANFDLPFDLVDMPSGELFREYFQPSVVWTRISEHGTYSHTVSSFGPELPFFVCVGIGGASLMAIREEQEVKAWPPAQEIPDPQGPQYFQKELRAAIELYKSEHGVFPETLQDLSVPTKNFPEGFLGKAKVSSMIEYRVLDTGDGYELRITTESIKKSHEHGGTGGGDQ